MNNIRTPQTLARSEKIMEEANIFNADSRIYNNSENKMKYVQEAMIRHYLLDMDEITFERAKRVLNGTYVGKV